MPKWNKKEILLLNILSILLFPIRLTLLFWRQDELAQRLRLQAL